MANARGACQFRIVGLHAFPSVNPKFRTRICIGVLAARSARGCKVNSAPRKQRAQGMPDARCTRGLACNVHKKVRTRAYRAAEAIRHPLRNGFTAYSALSPVIGFLVTVIGGILPANLTPASRRQNHTISPYASAPFVKSASASTAPCPTFVTMADAPLPGTGWPWMCP
jgi:hypothetical protein